MIVHYQNENCRETNITLHIMSQDNYSHTNPYIVLIIIWGWYVLLDYLESRPNHAILCVLHTAHTPPAGRPTHQPLLAAPSLRTVRRIKLAIPTQHIFTIPSLVVIMSGCGKWQSKDSTKTVDICPICRSSYPACQTCQKYGKQSHILDQEKAANAHDNQAYLQTEEKDPRKK